MACLWDWAEMVQHVSLRLDSGTLCFQISWRSVAPNQGLIERLYGTASLMFKAGDFIDGKDFNAYLDFVWNFFFSSYKSASKMHSCTITWSGTLHVIALKACFG